MDVVKRLLDSRLFWLFAGILLVGSIASMAHRGLVRDPRFMARPIFAGAELPAWADRGVLDPVVARVEALGPISLLQTDFEERVRGALADCAVLDSVIDVDRHWPRSYSVKLVFRRPCAVIEQGDLRIPVTADCIRLPSEPYDTRRLYPITGVPGPLAEPGELIDSDALHDGLATLRQLAPHLRGLRKLRIESIDVSGVEKARGSVILRTAHGISVRWGRPLSQIGENPVARKIEYLRAAQDNIGALEGYVIDVRFDEPYVRESPSP
jgi:hypothetical protein